MKCRCPERTLLARALPALAAYRVGVKLEFDLDIDALLNTYCRKRKNGQIGSPVYFKRYDRLDMNNGGLTYTYGLKHTVRQRIDPDLESQNAWSDEDSVNTEWSSDVWSDEDDVGGIDNGDLYTTQ